MIKGCPIIKSDNPTLRLSRSAADLHLLFSSELPLASANHPKVGMKIAANLDDSIVTDLVVANNTP